MKPTEITRIRDVEVTRLGLGSAPLGGLFTHVPDEAAHATIRHSYELGLRFFDTAPLYGYGNAEARLGAALAPYPRDSYALATKVGRLLRDLAEPETEYEIDTTQSHKGQPFYHDTGRAVPVFDFSYEAARRSLEESLGRLGLDHVDIAHVHDPDDHLAAAIKGACRALIDLREEGVIGAVGVGLDHPGPGLRFVQETDVDCLLIAGRWTLLDHEAGEQLLPAALEHGTRIIAAGVFNSGVLAAPQSNNSTFDYVPCPPAIAKRARQMAQVCQRFGVPLKAAALQFPYRHPAIAAVVVGARTPQEIEENVRMASLEIPDRVWQALSDECGVPRGSAPKSAV